MKASVVQADHSVKIEDRPTPKLGANQILIRSTAWGINPTDWKHAAFLSAPNTLLGCDVVGVVEEVGAGVSPDIKGQRRAMFMRGGMDEDNGAFSDFVRQDLDLTWQVPDKMTDVQAATMPIPFFTACQVFYQRMGLPQTVPSPHGKWMLVYSGASSVGQYAIQLAKRSGFNVVATASPSRESRLKSLGADAVVDYHAHDLAQKLKDATNDGITNAIDCFAEGESSKVCHDAMSSSQGGEVVAILPIPDNAISRKDVKASATILYTNLSGKPVKFGPAEFPPAGPHDREDAARFYEFFPQFAVDSGIKYLDVHELQGIEKIPEGLKLLQEGKVHGKKIVVKA